jgi:hypothetical protein
MVAVDADANSDGPAADEPSDEQRLAELANELADGVVTALGPWVVRSVERLCVAFFGQCPPGVLDDARAAGDQASREVGGEVRSLLATDVDHQRVNPLQLLRAATSYPTAVLRRAGVPPVLRDAEAERQFPDDDYDLTPASFADLDPALHNPGIAWGAGKAHVVLARRRAEGRR